ncbi:translation elongation factor Ts [Candidatus Wolfebacteria bacterium]|nr:translation elongation factor Ts [Candidatus Wolfebacteria bacterium]
MLKDVERLREMTGAGVMECKRAIEEAGGDMEKAVSLIHARGFERAEKKKDRATGAGLLHAFVHNDRVGVLVEIRSETDFVARSDEFKDLAHSLALQIAAMNPDDVRVLLAQPYIRDELITVEELVRRLVAKMGENIRVERFCRYEI